MRSAALLTCIALLDACAAQAQTTETAPVGDWDGELTVPAGIKVPLILHITDQGATMDSPDQNARAIPVVVTRHGTEVDVEIASTKARFSGALTPDGKSMIGPFAQSGMSMQARFTLRAAGAVVPQRDRPQTPQPPLPYVVEEVNFPGAGGVTLAGTLSRPKGARPFPAVMMIAGSGPQNRDETVEGHKVFLVIADRLTRAGVAVLRYDKRGVGASTGSYSQATQANFIADAEAAYAWLRLQPGIAQKRIGLLGHSEGAEIAPVVAERESGVRFVVLLSAPALPGVDIIVAQQRAVAIAMGVPAATVETNSRLEREVLEASRGASTPAAAQAAVQQLLVANGMPAEAATAQARQVASPWYRAFLSDDPAPALRRLRTPVLVVAGAKDLQVLPSQNLPVIRSALSNNRAAQIVELPGLNHLLQPATTGAPQEYGDISITVAPVALDLISRWVGDHAK